MRVVRMHSYREPAGRPELLDSSRARNLGIVFRGKDHQRSEHPGGLRPGDDGLQIAGEFLTGTVAYRFLPVASMPTVDFPTINVTASRPGADPEIMGTGPIPAST